MKVAINRRGARVPTELARRPLRTVRPRDMAHIYAQPAPELARLAARGAVHRVAYGYYVVVPPENTATEWLPDLEAVAAGVASAIYGPHEAVLMSVSAARALGALPRALTRAVVAVPKQHEPVSLTDRHATVQFVKRDIDSLDTELVSTELGRTLVTTPEQTLLDLAKRPRLGNAEVDVPDAVATLYYRSDLARLRLIATEQRLGAALRQAQLWATQ